MSNLPRRTGLDPVKILFLFIQDPLLYLLTFFVFKYSNPVIFYRFIYYLSSILFLSPENECHLTIPINRVYLPYDFDLLVVKR